MEIGKGGVWRGELPEDCTLVHLQWLDAAGNWVPDQRLLPAYRRDEAIRLVERAVREGPLRFEKYRLIPAIMKEKNMAKAKKGKKGATSAAEEGRVAGFRAGSIVARMYEVMADGKARTAEKIHDGLKGGTTLANVKNALLWLLRKRGRETGEFDIIREGKDLRMIFEPGVAPEASKPAVKKVPRKKAAKKPAKKATAKKAKKKAKTRAPKPAVIAPAVEPEIGLGVAIE